MVPRTLFRLHAEKRGAHTWDRRETNNTQLRGSQLNSNNFSKKTVPSVAHSTTELFPCQVAA